MRFPLSRSRARLVAGAVFVLALAGASPPAGADPAQHAGRPDEPGYRRMDFPVPGAGYSNDWHAPRSGGRLHMGNDLFAPKHAPAVAAADGVVSFLRVEDSGLSGRMLTIRDADGWSYRYIHLNNDTPGTDDGVAGPEHTLAPGISQGAKVSRGQVVAYVGDSGNAEGTASHVHFEVLSPEGEQVNPYPSLRLSQGRPVGNLCRYDDNPVSQPRAASGGGYYALDAAGGVFSFGDASFAGSIPGLRAVGVPVGPAVPLAIEATPDGGGYWILDDRGGVFAFGNATFHGSIPDLRRQGVAVGPMQPVTIEATPDGGGYWILDDRGGVFAFGNAGFHGSIPDLRARGVSVGSMEPVDLESTSDGTGYWILDDLGGVFGLGNAAFHGSLGTLRQAGVVQGRVGVAGIAAAPDGSGYWIVDQRGGAFAFGGARYLGSVPGVGLCEWADVVGVIASATGQGYWMIGTDGRVWSFGDARYLGAMDVGGIQHARAVGMTLAA